MTNLVVPILQKKCLVFCEVEVQPAGVVAPRVQVSIFFRVPVAKHKDVIQAHPQVSRQATPSTSSVLQRESVTALV